MSEMKKTVLALLQLRNLVVACMTYPDLCWMLTGAVPAEITALWEIQKESSQPPQSETKSEEPVQQVSQDAEPVQPGEDTQPDSPSNETQGVTPEPAPDEQPKKRTRKKKI